MALPELTLPSGTPAFTTDHSIVLSPLFADVPMRTGHHRRRRVYTIAPRVVNVKLDLTLAQVLAFHQWFEGPLKAGTELFAAQVANQGPGLLWWTAKFLEPYTADADPSGVSFWVFGKLLLTGEGSTDGPYTPYMFADTVVPLSGTAVVTSPITLSADTVVALQPQSYMTAATTVPLISYLVFFELLREDGSSFQRESDSTAIYRE